MKSRRVIKRRAYQNKVLKKLCVLLLLNSFIYFTFSDRAMESDITHIHNFVNKVGEYIVFNHSLAMFVFINIILIALASIKIFFKGRRIPIVLLLALLYMLRVDDIMAIRLGEYGLALRRFANDLPMTNWMIVNFIDSEYKVENINYAIALCMPLYLLVKKNILDKFFLGKDSDKSPKSSSSASKSYGGSSSKSYGTSSGGYTPTTTNYGNYDEEDDYYYDNKKKSSWFSSWNTGYGDDKFRIMSEYDKKLAYDMRFTNPNDTIIDESGFERYVWEYANEYENDRRAEEEERRRQEEQYYNDYNNNSYNNYWGSSSDDDYYSSWNNSSNDDYYNSWGSGNDSYYDNNDSGW